MSTNTQSPAPSVASGSQGWCPPQQGFIKVNIDAAFVEGKAAAAIVETDAKEIERAVSAKEDHSCCSAFILLRLPSRYHNSAFLRIAFSCAGNSLSVIVSIPKSKLNNLKFSATEDMESIGLLEPVVDHAITPVVRQVGYLINYKSNVHNLETKTGNYVRLYKDSNTIFSIKDFNCDSNFGRIQKDNINMIGVYGMGGVGKTTLVKQVARKAEEEKLFGNVVKVEVKQNTEAERIQREIAEKLGVKFGESGTLIGREHIVRQSGMGFDEKHTVAGRARILSNFIKDKKILVILTTFGKSLIWKNWEFQLGCVKFCCKSIKGPQRITLVERRFGASKRKANVRNCILGHKVELRSVGKRGAEITVLFFGMLGGRDHFLEDMLKYTLGLGLNLYEGINAMEDSRNRLHSLVDKLKDTCLLLDTDVNGKVIMHDLVCEFARKIASTDQRFLSLEYVDLLKEWPIKEFLEKCTTMSLYQINVPNLPDELECPSLQHFDLFSKDKMLEIPPHLFKKMKQLKVLDLTNLHIPSLPSSIQSLTSLQTLCLDLCELRDISIVGDLRSLEILSLVYSRLKQLPKEIGCLTRLRLLDLSGCPELEVIYPDVIRSLTRLEELNMNNSFNKWETEEASNNIGGRSNASLSELKHLPNLTTLGINIEDAYQLPINFSLKNKDGFQRLKKLHVQNNPEISHVVHSNIGYSRIHSRTVFPILEALSLYNLVSLESVCTGQLAVESFKKIEVEDCKNLKEIVEGKEELVDEVNDPIEFHGLRSLTLQNLPELISFSSYHSPLVASTNRNPMQLFNDKVVFPKLEALKLSSIPLNKLWDDQLSARLCWIQNLTSLVIEARILRLEALENLEKFCTSASSTEFPCLQRLIIENCTKLGPFIVDPIRRKNVIDAAGHDLFDEKVGFPRLEYLSIKGLHKLTSIWHTQLAPNSFCKLIQFRVISCSSLIHILVPGILERLQSLKDLIVLDSPVAKHLEKLEKLRINNCEVLEQIVGEEEKFLSGKHTSMWPSLKELMFQCDKIEILAEEYSSFQQQQHEQAKRPLFLFEKGSFSNLEVMHICFDFHVLQYSLVPLEFFKITHLRMYFIRNPTSADLSVFLQRLHNLKTLELVYGDMEEIFLNEELHVFAHLRTLTIRAMHNLIQVWKENSHLAGPVFTDLEILKVEDCGRLVNIVSSAISFRNLVQLEVLECHELKHLISCSVAKSFVQLQSMRVENCQAMVEILASSDDTGNIDDADANEITFGRLKDLKLSNLQNLKGFCSRNYNVIFPFLTTLSVTRCLEMKISIDGVLQNDSKHEVLRITEEEEKGQDDDNEDNNDDVDEFEKWG
ncbi:hypothetical protein FNV43_RR08629 [Rhamnella rubrinervis]|uniref:Uncharacterized protein n=1 Tax=Rhamnella rubrinervis TaxID=2594499 RepID=A0A8K0MJ91_9ROSA|nr:hypothetical protein FNV43_RR08629 [Rhamnella rubrinervis]